MAHVLKVDGFGGTVSQQGDRRIAADLTALGLPAESLGMYRRSEPGSDGGWLALIGRPETWIAILAVYDVGRRAVLSLAETADATEKLEAIRRRLVAALGKREKYFVLATIPHPWDDRDVWGAYAELSLAPDVFVDGLRMFADRALGIDAALRSINEEGHLPLGNVGCLLSEKGFRLRWTSGRGFKRHEADFTVDGERRGLSREGWTEVDEFPAP